MTCTQGKIAICTSNLAISPGLKNLEGGSITSRRGEGPVYAMQSPKIKEKKQS